MPEYGTAPVPVPEVYPGSPLQPDDWHEQLRYLYLPVSIPGAYEAGQPYRRAGFVLPRRLRPLRGLIGIAARDAIDQGRDFDVDHLYVTAKHGYATPENPLNRPGWHTDGFGTDDLNYVWWDRWPTRFAVHPFHDISDDHHESMAQFDRQAQARPSEVEDQTLYRLDPYCVHTTPIIPAPGGMRRFVKISVSRHRYNLLGNSHNYGIDYDWEMFPRDAARNDPAQYGRDYYEEPVDG